MGFELYILLLGLVVVLVMLVRPALERIGVPPLVGYFVLGFVLRLADARWQVLGSTGIELFELLGYVGVIVLLFRVGLESDLPGLLERLPTASLLWAGNITVSGGLGYWVAAQWLGWDMLPSLFVAVALTATSVGATVALWEQAGALETEEGTLLLDVAEMDDISGVVLMGILFTMAPVLHTNPNASIAPLAAQTLGLFVLKFGLFTAGCVLFARYLEAPTTAFFERIQSWPGTIMVVIGFGLMVAAIAGLLGFSVAIGAFFAGLIFSRDPDAIKLDASFDAIYPLFGAFFFIGIGLRVDPGALSGAIGPVTALLGVAVAGKVLGTLLPALAVVSGASGLLLGLSLVPRAEIMLIIMQRGTELGPWAVPPDVFANMVMVAAATTLLAPLVVRPLLEARS